MKCYQCNQKLVNRFLAIFQVKRNLVLQCPNCYAPLLNDKNARQWLVIIICLMILLIESLSLFVGYLYYVPLAIIISSLYAGLTIPINQRKPIKIHKSFWVAVIIFAISKMLITYHPDLKRVFVGFMVMAWAGMFFCWKILTK